MRDRLSKMIQDSVGGCAKHWADTIADYLISNNVIVLQCKVGDTVYQTDGERIFELEIFDVSLCLRKYKPYYETESIDFDADAIGKSVFLTREEAESEMIRIQRSENDT
jgi:hypothetical protein